MIYTNLLNKVLFWSLISIFSLQSGVFALQTLPEGTDDGFVYAGFSEQKYLTTNITPKRNNTMEDVLKLQNFFNTYEKETLTLTGEYDTDTQGAVQRFQVKYAAHILTPWGISNPTVNVGVTTRAKINNIVYGTERKIDCPGVIQLPKIGQSSPDMPYIRRFLKTMDFYITDESSYLYDTEVYEALKQLQVRYGINLPSTMRTRDTTRIGIYTTNLLVGCDAPQIVW